jgi:hypothetical protein
MAVSAETTRKDTVVIVAAAVLAISLILCVSCWMFWMPPLEIDGMRSPTNIRSINWDESIGQIRVLVEYTGNGTVTLEEVYSNETLDPEAVIATRVLSKGQTTEIILSETYVTKPTQITVRVATSDGYDAFKAKIFYAITLEQVDWDERTSKIRVVVKNYGDETVTLSEVYVNGTLDASALPHPLILQKDQKAVITLSGTYTDTHTSIPIKVMTLEGASSERASPIYGIWIQSINWNHNTGEIVAYVYANGYEDVKVNGVYVNGTLDAAATILTHSTNSVWTITLSTTYANNPPYLTLKVVTADGAFAELTSWHLNKF